MEANNMRYWEKVKAPPVSALKKISGGRMNGKTDISPMWRIQAMTELCGPCGEGWKYTIDKLWTEPGVSGEVMAFALVSVYFRTADGWSEGVQGIGGNMLIAKESAGLRSSDEAYKMAVTDALSVAFKSLGFAAEVYLGNFDGSKYVNRGNSQNQYSQSTEQGIPTLTATETKYLAAINAANDTEELRRVGEEIGSDKSLGKDFAAVLRSAYENRNKTIAARQN